MELAQVISIIAVAFGFGIVVFVHEGGHFLAARLCGMKVHEFSIGFGRPLLFWFRRNETQYSFRLWPFFSYVRIAGMEPGDDDPRGFDRKPRVSQAFVLVSGCVMNILLAVGIFVFMGGVIGRPVAVTNTVQRVLPGTPAAHAGLRPGDKLLGVDGRRMKLEDLQAYISERPGKPIVIDVERGGRTFGVGVTPRRESIPVIEGKKLIHQAVGRVGVVFRLDVAKMSLWQSIRAGFVDTYNLIHLLIAYLVGLISGKMPFALVGPVGVADQLYREAQVSWVNFLSTTAALTVGLGVLNLMPVPPLDGSRLAIVAIEALRRRPFDKRKEVVVHLIGFALFLALVAVLTYKDILRIVRYGGN